MNSIYATIAWPEFQNETFTFPIPLLPLPCLAVLGYVHSLTPKFFPVYSLKWVFSLYSTSLSCQLSAKPLYGLSDTFKRPPVSFTPKTPVFTSRHVNVHMAIVIYLYISGLLRFSLYRGMLQQPVCVLCGGIIWRVMFSNCLRVSCPLHLHGRVAGPFVPTSLSARHVANSNHRKEAKL
jgi:hypothetical protein